MQLRSLRPGRRGRFSSAPFAVLAGLQFVIRGCESQIYKPNVGVQEVACATGTSPSLCYCEENLCNGGGEKARPPLLLGLLLALLLARAG